MSLMSPTSYQTAPSRDIISYITLLNAENKNSTPLIFLNLIKLFRTLYVKIMPIMGLSKKKIYFIVFLSIAILCTAGFLWAWFVTRDIRKNVSGALNQSQKVIVKHLILTETKDHKKYWELYAKTGSYESSNKTVILTGIMGNFYDKDKNVALSFESPKGTYEDATKTVTLEGETLIVSKDGSSILADKIEWGGKNTDIIASGNVRIKRNEELATISEKAIFNSDLTFFKIIGKSQTLIFAKEGQQQEELNLFSTKGK